MSCVISLLSYPLFLQSRSLMVLTCPCWRMSGELPPDLKVPHPVIQQFVPGLTSLFGTHTVPTQLFNLKAFSSLIMAMSFSVVLGL